MTILTFLPTHNILFWRGFLIASCLWLCVLNVSLWYWRRKIRELRAMFTELSTRDSVNAE